MSPEDPIEFPDAVFRFPGDFPWYIPSDFPIDCPDPYPGSGDPGRSGEIVGWFHTHPIGATEEILEALEEDDEEKEEEEDEC